MTRFTKQLPAYSMRQYAKIVRLYRITAGYNDIRIPFFKRFNTFVIEIRIHDVGANLSASEDMNHKI